MLCSPAEIERKRQEALQKLARKNESPVKLKASASGKNPYPNVNEVIQMSPFKSSSQSPLCSNKKLKKPYEKISTKSGSKPTLDFYGLNRAVTAKIILMSAEKFCVKMSSYFTPIVDALKTVPSKCYDPKTQLWSFHVKDYALTVMKLKMLKGQNVKIEPLPRFVINCLKGSYHNTDDIDTARIDPTLFQSLLPFQVEGLRFGVLRDGRCLIADEMGLGKTFQALAIMNYYKNDWPLLIVTTASMKNVWEETILKYLPSVSVLQVQYMISSKDFIGNSSILIVSHDLMSRCCDKLQERGFGCIIIDESHNLKNYKAKMTVVAVKLCKAAKRVVLLSGTPALSRPSELFPQLNLIDDSFFGSFIEYAKRYCDLQQTNFGLNSSGKSNLQELEAILRIKFMISRRKEDVLGSLPNKTQEVIKLKVNFNSLDNEDKQLLDILSSKIIETNKPKDKHALLLTFFCETAKIKIPAVCAHIKKVMETKKKFLVFAHHLVMLDAIEEMFKQRDYQYIRIDGSTPGDQRKYFVDKFQTNESCLCALLSITATNAGITLTAAQHVVFAELHWNPTTLNQAEARVHRIGQENEVLVQYLLAEGTADDHIWPLLQEKQNILREMGLTKEEFSDVHQKDEDSLKDNRNATCENSVMQTDEDSILDDGLDDIFCSIDL